MPEVEFPSDFWFGTAGPHDAEIVLVGEAWGEQEAYQKKPFVGPSGAELTRILSEAGLDRSKILILNVAPTRPPGNEMWRLYEHPKQATSGPVLRGLHPGLYVRKSLERLGEQIRFAPRKLVIACGNYALWALTPHTSAKTTGETQGIRVPQGIGEWRGSMTYCLHEYGHKVKCLPIFHPAAILRQWSLRALTVHDLKARVPLALADDWEGDYNLLTPPTIEQIRKQFKDWFFFLNKLGKEIQLAVDVETAQGFITTLGIADSHRFALSIPFVKDETFASYWSLDEEAEIIGLLGRLLTHPKCQIVGQNFIYDTQYIQRWFGVTPRLSFDTMLGHHLLFPGTRKDLGTLSSLYCHYHKVWFATGADTEVAEWDLKTPLADRLYYNALDCCKTWEIASELIPLIKQLGKWHLWEERLEVNATCLELMNRGVRIDKGRRAAMKEALREARAAFQDSLLRIIPQEWVTPDDPKASPWYRSPKQQQIVFGEILGMKLPKHRKTGRTTLGKEALKDLPKKYPEWQRLFDLLESLRSIDVFDSHFVSAALEPDGRMRCSYNPGGTETFRLSSSANAFGRGTNLQNIPKGNEE